MSSVNLEEVCLCVSPWVLAQMCAEMAEMHADVEGETDDPVCETTEAAIDVAFDALVANVGLPESLRLIGKARANLLHACGSE